MATAKKKAKVTKVTSKSKPVVKTKTATKPKAVKAVKPAVVKIPKLVSPRAPYKQSELYTVLAEQSSLSKNQVKAVLEALNAIAKVHLTKNGPGQFTLPGMLKVTLVTKPATKARQGRNPFTGEEITIKAKPARKAVKVKALKKFKAELE